MARSHDHTVRKGTSERNWYFLAGYVTISIIGVAYTFATWESTAGTDSQLLMTGFTAAIVVLALSVAGLGTYPALFRDSAYIRDTSPRWSPKWWYYITAGIGLPVVSYFVLNLIYTGETASTVAVMFHALTATIVASMYLYRRHKFIGVP